MSDQPKTRVVVLGGGCGSIAAAFALTATEALRARYDVTVYQLGWRLGGKGASGRNAAAGERIEEHGLHMWLGFYDDAFRTMRECYREWDGPVSFEDAFFPQRQITLQEWVESGPEPHWETWNIDVPALPGKPGVEGPPLPVELLRALLDALSGHYAKAGLDTRAPDGYAALAAARQHVASLTDDALRETPHHREVLLTHLETARTCAVRAPAAPAAPAAPGAPTAESDDPFLRRAALLLELGFAIAKGFVLDVLPYGNAGYDRIDHLEFRDWLTSHGASAKITWSAPVRALYDLGFAYVEGIGDPEHAQAAAGVALRVLLGIAFGSRGAPLWKMYAGMGDTVFSPFYDVLRKRGVQFRFFHRVQSVQLSPTGTLVQRVKLSRQVDVLAGVEDYHPQITVSGGPAWPNAPLWDQIRNGAEIAERLEREHLTLESPQCKQEVGPVDLELGRDFDLVLLGISLGAFPAICGELIATSEAWQSMVENIPTVGTEAFQLWLNEPLAKLGWTAGPTVETSYAEPFDTWADMSHLIPREAWPPRANVQSIHYYCGAMPNRLYPVNPDAGNTGVVLDRVVRDRALEWLETYIAHLWPEAMVDGHFNWDLLVDLQDGTGTQRFDAQFFRSNLAQSERYVLSPAGSIRFRLPQHDADFDNLFLAGDWTRTQYNAGCVEAAIESGQLAARAIRDYTSGGGAPGSA